MFLKEDHPLALNLSFKISLGLLPVTLSLKPAGCGIKSSVLSDEEAGDVENSRNDSFTLVVGWLFLLFVVKYVVCIISVIFYLFFRLS